MEGKEKKEYLLHGNFIAYGISEVCCMVFVSDNCARFFGGKEPFSIYRYILDVLISPLNERVGVGGVRKEIVQ